VIIEKIAHIDDRPMWNLIKPHVLIIEDNLDIQEMYMIAFHSKWYSVTASSDGLDGVTKAVSIKPDIIILDIMMPHMDGFEVLHTLKNNTTLKSTVIVNSNLEWVDEEKKVKELWADYFLRKSHYTPLEVIEFIETYILKMPA
jgi:DNA-binding response OmpR family regulator